MKPYVHINFLHLSQCETVGVYQQDFRYKPDSLEQLQIIRFFPASNISSITFHLFLYKNYLTPYNVEKNSGLGKVILFTLK